MSTHELGAFTTYTKRVYYDTYDATDAMRLAGGSSHTIGVSVGDGWYSQDSVNVGQQTLILQVRTAPRCCALQPADASVSCACGLVCVCSGGAVRLRARVQQPQPPRQRAAAAEAAAIRAHARKRLAPR